MNTSAIRVFYTGIQFVQVIDSENYESGDILGFVYLTTDVDRVQSPVILTEEQCKQLYRDLKEAFNESE